MKWQNWWKQASGKQPQTQPETLLGYLLEPRMVFDGAVVATAVEVVSDTGTSAPAETSSDADANSAGTGDATSTDSGHASSLYVAAAVGSEAGASADVAAVSDVKAVVFVDTSVSNYQSLLDELPSDIEVVLLDGSQDGLSQMAHWAESHTGYDAIHIISHGTEGSLTLGATQLNSQSLASHSSELQTLGQALTTEGDILLYGCDVASGVRGQQFISDLAALAGADVAASSDDTGSASLGGNWQLEQHIGVIDAQVPLSLDIYSGLLATFDLSGATGSGSKEVRQTIGADTLIITAGDEPLIVDDVTALALESVLTLNGNVIETANGLYAYESNVTLTVADGKIFDLSQFVVVDVLAENKGITITTNKGSETFSAAFIDGSWSSSLAGNSKFQGVTYAKIETSDASGQFCWAFDNFVLNNIQLPDTTAPAAPSAPVLDSASDLGASNSDRLTSDNTPTLSGTAEADSTVTLYDTNGTTALGSIKADSLGNWSITSSSLSAGAHTLTVKATDGAGNVSPASSGLSITIDATAPTAPSAPDLSAASDSGSSSTDNLTNDTTPTLTGTAEANATITMYDGGVSIGTVTADGSGNWSFTTGALTAGSHSLTATATDTAGGISGASAALTLSIDTSISTPPAPDLTVASDLGISNSDNLTSDTTPTLSGTAEANATVTLYDGATLLGTATANSSGNWSFTSNALGDGDHTLTATQTDVAGNVSAASTALTIAIDASAPAVPSAPDLDASSDSGLNTDNLTSDNTPTVTGTADAGSTVTLYDTDGTTVLGTATADGSGNWSITCSVLSAGAHTLTTKATDGAGNTSSASSGLSITIDAAAPAAPSAPDLSAASDSGSSSTDNLTNDTTPTLTGTAEANATITMYDGGVSIGTVTADSSGDWSFTTGVLAAGSHSLTAMATDAAGNISGASAALVLTIDTSISTPSAPDLTSASDSGTSNTDNLTNATTPTLIGTAEAGSTVTLYDTDGSTVLGSTTANGSGNWLLTSSALSAGAHTLTAKATDGAGNVSSVSSGLIVTLDAIAPAVPSALDLDASSDSGSSSTDSLTSDNTPTVTGTADAGSTVTLYDTDGTTVLGTATADSSGNWSITSSALSAGAHTLTAKAMDGAGNVSSASSALSVTIDATAPTVPSAPDLSAASDSGSSSTDNLTNDTTPILTGTAEANATITMYDGGVSIGTVTADSSGDWSFTTGALTAGSHSLTATATDAAGNISGATAALVLTIDTSISTPSAPDLASASDSGTSNTDNLTNDTTPTLTGTAEANATVTLYDTDGSTALGTTTADGSGNWSITSSALGDGAHSLTVRATDGAGNVSVASATLVLTIDTQLPGSASGSLSILEGSDPGSAVGTVTATDGSSYVLLDDAGGRFTIDGATGAVTVADASLLDFESATSHSITVQVTDAAGNTRNTALLVTVTDSSNEAAPVISSNGGGATATISLLEGATSVTTVAASDADAGSTLSYSITGGGDGARFTIDPATGALSFVTTPDFETPADSNTDNSYSVTVQVSDGLRTDSQTITVNVGNSNDAPTVNTPGSIGVTEDVVTAVTGISFSDVDAGSNSVTVTLAAGSGALTAISGSGVTIAGSGSSTLVLTGSVANINSFIAGSLVGFTTAANSSSDVTLDVTINDGGNSGSGGAQSAHSAVTLDVSAVNDAPAIVAPGSIAITEDVASALTGISFTDVDAGSNPVTVTLAVNAGTLAAVTGSGVTVGGSATTLTLSGTISDINSFINASKVSFTNASNATGNVTLTTSINDGGNTGSGGAQSDSTTTSLSVSAVNDAPVNQLPAGQFIAQDATLIFSSANGNSITVSDVDIGAAVLQVTLTASHGVINLPSSTGLSFSVGDGSSDQTMTFSGSVSDINNALNGLSFTPTSGFSGSATLSVVTHDLGSSGSGGSQSDSDSLTITVNHSPTANPISAQSALEDSNFSFVLPTNTFSDVDVGDTLTLSATRADGSALPSWLSFNASTGTFSGTPENGDVGSISVRVTATDAAGAAVSSNFTLNVANTNDAPVSHGIAGQNVREDAAFSFTLPANTFSDVDAGDHQSLGATLADGSVLPSWLSFNASTGTFSGTPENGDVGSISVRVTATDPAGALVSSNFTLNVANTNDAPVSNVIPDQMTNAGSTFSFELPAATFVDVDDGDTSILNATLADGSALPSWLSFDVASGTFSGSPTNRDISTLQLQVTVVDSQGATASTQFQLVVAPSTQPGGDPEFKVNDGATRLDSLDGESSPTSPTVGSTSAEWLAPAPLVPGDSGGELLATAIFANQSQGGSPGASLLASVFQSGSSPLPESPSWAVQHRVPAMQGDHSTLGRVFNTSPLDYGPQLEIFASGSWHHVLADTAAGPGYPLAALSLQQQLDAMAQDPAHLIDAIISTSKPVAQQPG